MELIDGVLKSLSIDQTIFYQLAVFVSLFWLLDIIMFRRLQEILELRESKTVKLEDKAEQKLKDAENLAACYRERIEQAKTEGQSVYNQHKKEVVEKQHVQLKRAEKEIDQEIECQRKEFKEQLVLQREQLLKNTDSLSQKLMEKLTS